MENDVIVAGVVVIVVELGIGRATNQGATKYMGALLRATAQPMCRRQ